MASQKELRALIVLAGKVDPSLQSSIMKASKLQGRFSNEAKKAGGVFAKVGTIAKGVFIGNMVTAGIEKAGAALVETGQKGLQLASDLSEVQNVVDVTFGKDAAKINQWSQKALNAYGESELQAKRYTSTLGAMMKSSGITGQNLVKMSQNLSGLAGDFSSFYNIAQDDAFDKIRAGISGETEPLKQLGINMSVANLNAYALSKGIKASYEKMDQASQTALRYSYLMHVSKDAQGDFARTQGSFANQQRLLKANFEQIAAKIMSKALPALTKLMQISNSFLDKIDVGKVSDAVGAIADGLMPLFSQITSKVGLITSGITPIIPVISEVANKSLPFIKEIFKAFYDADSQIIPVLGNLIKNLLPVIPPVLAIISATLKPILPVISSAISLLGSAANKILASLIPALNAIMPVIGTVAQFLSKVWMAQWQNLTPVINNVVGILTSLLDFITNVFTGNWKGALNNIGGIFGNVFGGLGNLAIAPLNTVIDLVNSFTKSLGAIKIPDWIPELGGKSFNIPAIPKLQTFANGGIASKPSIFGEGGPEMAIPLRRNQRSYGLLNQTSQILGYPESRKHGGNTFNITINAPGGNAQEIEETIRRILDEYFPDGGPAFGW